MQNARRLGRVRKGAAKFGLCEAVPANAALSVRATRGPGALGLARLIDASHAPESSHPLRCGVTSLDSREKKLWMAEDRSLKGGRGAASVARIGGMRDQTRQLRYASSAGFQWGGL